VLCTLGESLDHERPIGSGRLAGPLARRLRASAGRLPAYCIFSVPQVGRFCRGSLRRKLHCMRWPWSLSSSGALIMDSFAFAPLSQLLASRRSLDPQGHVQSVAVEAASLYVDTAERRHEASGQELVVVTFQPLFEAKRCRSSLITMA
jgi:hypothetical protein